MKILFTVSSFLVLFFSSFRLVEGNIILAVYGLYGLITALLLAPFLFKDKRFEYNKSLAFLAVLFTIFATASAIHNVEAGMIFNSILFSVLFFSVTVVLYTYYKEDLAKNIFRLLIISHIPLLLLPLALYGFDSAPYQGIFYNSNAFGMVCTTLFTAIFAVLLAKLEKIIFYKENPNKLNIAFYFLSAFLVFLLIVFSASRTSFLAGLSVALIGFFLLFVFAIKNKRVLNLMLKSLKIVPILVVMFFILNKFIPLTLYVNQIIFGKFERKGEDLLDGRGSVWLETMKNAGLLGNGESYFNESVGLGAHNTFVYILGVYGWIPVIIFMLFIVISFLYSLKFAIKSEDIYKFLPLFSLLTFLMLSMGENLFFKLPMILTFTLLGIVVNNRKVAIVK